MADGGLNQTLVLEEYTDQRYNYEPIMSKNSILRFVPAFIEALDPVTKDKVYVEVMKENGLDAASIRVMEEGQAEVREIAADTNDFSTPLSEQDDAKLTAAQQKIPPMSDDYLIDFFYEKLKGANFSEVAVVGSEQSVVEISIPAPLSNEYLYNKNVEQILLTILNYVVNVADRVVSIHPVGSDNIFKVRDTIKVDVASNLEKNLKDNYLVAVVDEESGEIKSWAGEKIKYLNLNDTLTKYRGNGSVNLKIRMNPEKIPVENYNPFTIKVDIEGGGSQDVDSSDISATGNVVQLEKFLRSPLIVIVMYALQKKYDSTTLSTEDIMKLVETYDIILPGTPNDHKIQGDTVTVKNLRDNTDPAATEIELKLKKKTTKTGFRGLYGKEKLTTDTELFHREDGALESAERYFKEMIQNKEANATFVSVKVPANKIPGEIHEARISDLSHSFMGKMGQAMGRNDSTQTGCGGRYIKFMIRKDMIPGENIILLCKAPNNLDSKGRNFIPLSRGFNFKQVKGFVEKLKISDIVDKDVREAVELLTRYIEENELEIDRTAAYSVPSNEDRLSVASATSYASDDSDDMRTTASSAASGSTASSDSSRGSGSGITVGSDLVASSPKPADQPFALGQSESKRKDKRSRFRQLRDWAGFGGGNNTMMIDGMFSTMEPGAAPVNLDPPVRAKLKQGVFATMTEESNIFIITKLIKYAINVEMCEGHIENTTEVVTIEYGELTVIDTDETVETDETDETNIMFVRHAESGSNRGKASLHDMVGSIIPPSTAALLEPTITGFKPAYLTKRARLQAFNHGYHVIPEYLDKKKDEGNPIKLIKMYCSVLPRAMETAKLSAYGFECAQKERTDLYNVVLETIIKPILDVSELPPTGKVGIHLGSVTMPVGEYLTTVQIVNLMNPGDNQIYEAPLPQGTDEDVLKVLDKDEYSVIKEWNNECKELEKHGNYARYAEWLIHHKKQQKQQKASISGVSESSERTIKNADVIADQVRKAQIDRRAAGLVKGKVKEGDMIMADSAIAKARTQAEGQAQQTAVEVTEESLMQQQKELEARLEALRAQMAARSASSNGGGKRSKRSKRSRRKQRKKIHGGAMSTPPELRRSTTSTTSVAQPPLLGSSAPPSTTPQATFQTAGPAPQLPQESPKTSTSIIDIEHRSAKLQKKHSHDQKGNKIASVLSVIGVTGGAALGSVAALSLSPIYDVWKNIKNSPSGKTGLKNALARIPLSILSPFLNILLIVGLLVRGSNETFSKRYGDFVFSQKKDSFNNFLKNMNTVFTPNPWPRGPPTKTYLLNNLETKQLVYYLYGYCVERLETGTSGWSNIDRGFILLLYIIVQLKRFKFEGGTNDDLLAFLKTELPKYDKSLKGLLKDSGKAADEPEVAGLVLSESGSGFTVPGSISDQFSGSGWGALLPPLYIKIVRDDMIAGKTALEGATSIKGSSSMTAQTSDESEESGSDKQPYSVDIDIYVANTVTNEVAVLNKINDLTIFPGSLGKRQFTFNANRGEPISMKRVGSLKTITEGELNDVDPTKSIIVTLIDGILRLLQGVFKHNYELIIKAAIDNVVTTGDFDSIANEVWDQLKNLRDGLVSSLDFFAGSINSLKDEYKRDLDNIVTDTKQYIDPVYLPDILYNSMTSQLHSLEESAEDETTGINVSLFFQHSSFNTLRTALIAVTSSVGSNAQLEGKYGECMRHWIGHQYKYTSYKLFIDQLDGYNNIIRKYGDNTRKLFDVEIDSLNAVDKEGSSAKGTSLTASLAEPFDPGPVGTDAGDEDDDDADSDASSDASDDSDVGNLDDLDELAGTFPDGGARLTRGGNNKDALHIVFTHGKNMLKNIVPATEDITENVREDETGLLLENQISKALGGSPDSGESIFKHMPDENDTKGNRTYLKHIMYTKKNEYVSKGNKHNYQRIQEHWSNILARQCAYFDKSYVMEDMTDPANINLASISFTLNPRGLEDLKESEALEGSEALEESEALEGAAKEGAVMKGVAWSHPEYLAPPDLRIPDISSEQAELVPLIIQLLHEHRRTLIADLTKDRVDAQSMRSDYSTLLATQAWVQSDETVSSSPQLTYGTYYDRDLQTQTIVDNVQTVKIANLLNKCLIRVTKTNYENEVLIKNGIGSQGISPHMKQKINELLDELVKKFKIEEGIKSGVIVSYEELVQHINKYLFLFEKILYRHEKMCVKPSNTPQEEGKLEAGEVKEMFKKLNTYNINDDDVEDGALKPLIRDLTELSDDDEVDSAVAAVRRWLPAMQEYILFDDFYEWYSEREVPAPAIPEVSPFEVEVNKVFKENLRKLIYQIELDENMRGLFSNMKENDNDGDDEVTEPLTITKYVSGFVRVITSIVVGIVGAITAAGLWTGAIAGGAPVIAGIICCLFVIDLCIRPSKSYIARALQLFTITFRNLFSGIGEGIRGAVKSITKGSRGGYRSNRKKTNRKKTNRRKTNRRKTTNKGRKTTNKGRKTYRRKNIKKTTNKKNRRKNIKRTNQKTNKKVRKQ